MTGIVYDKSDSRLDFFPGFLALRIAYLQRAQSSGIVCSMATSNQLKRVLHMADPAREHLRNARLFAMTEGLEEELYQVLEYVRTYGAGSENEMRTELTLDFPFNKNEYNFIAHIYKIVDGQKRPIITIGIIYDARERKWNTHS